MDEEFCSSLLEQQRLFFKKAITRSYRFRIEQLKTLKALLQDNAHLLSDALYKDLHKTEMEANLTEILIVIKEIDFMLKHLKKWMQPQRVKSSFPIMWAGHSYIYAEPYGCTLIMAAWNYPCQLIMSPLVGAICAGNCAIIKPSEVAPNTERVIAQLIANYFPADYITTVTGGPEIAKVLLKEKWDYIFYTGSASIGQQIMEAAAKKLTPITLELGGKSPCIVDETADLDFAARRIIWGKMSNAGQICIAPDYLYVHESCKAALLNKMRVVLNQFYGDDCKQSASYGRIINKNHFDRIRKLMQYGNIIAGGEVDEQTLFIAPTLMDNITWDSPIMHEEIFGPLLPILTFTHLDEAIEKIGTLPKPLALYLFTRNKNTAERLINEVSFGGGCINDCLLHVANLYLPFGGVGQSGMGRYHGKFSFDTFSHQKSIYKKLWLIDFKLEYPPFTHKKWRWLKPILKLW